MAKEKIAVAIVGTGWVSTEHIAAAVANPATEVRAICGSDEDRARKRLDDAVETHEICFAMEEAAQSGRPVALPLRK